MEGLFEMIAEAQRVGLRIEKELRERALPVPVGDDYRWRYATPCGRVEIVTDSQI